MDLLGQNNNNQKNNDSTKSKKMVLSLLIVCVILLIIIIACINVIRKSQPKKLSISFNEKEIKLEELLVDNQGNLYMPLQKGAELLGYKYFNGEYGKNQEDKNNCYLQNTNEAIGFKLDSKEIYKKELGSIIEEQKYQLGTPVIQKDGALAVKLEDFAKACNVIVRFDKTKNQYIILSSEHMNEKYKNEFAQNKKFKSVSEEYKNIKTISYGMLVVNDGEKYGAMNILDKNLNAIIGAKYDALKFDEYTQSFIAKDQGKWGVLSKDGTEVKIEFKYEEINIIKYEPLLYGVKLNNKYGVLDKTGKVIVNIEYDSLGYKDVSGKDESTLIIHNLVNEKNEKEVGIVVGKEKKYGLINIETGKTIAECKVDKIYSKISNGVKQYYVSIQDKEFTLDQYIEYINTTVVVTN